MRNLLIVAKRQSYLASSLRDIFIELEYEVIIEEPNVNDLKAIEVKVEAILIYADELLKERVQALTYLREWASEDHIPIFVVGSQEEQRFIEVVIPMQYIQKEFTRPINVREVAIEIHNMTENYAFSEKKKILVVDDSGAVLRNVRELLGSKYEVIMANSGAVAIKYISLGKPDLILLDYEMPVCDGAHVFEMLKSEPEFADIPIIFLTSKNDKETVMKVMALHPEGYLLKTMPPAQIIESVDNYFIKHAI